MVVFLCAYNHHSTYYLKRLKLLQKFSVKSYSITLYMEHVSDVTICGVEKATAPGNREHILVVIKGYWQEYGVS